MASCGRGQAPPLIWNDRVKYLACPLSWRYLRLCILRCILERYGTAFGLLRRFISLIYAGRNRMIVCSSGAASIYKRGSAQYTVTCVA